MLNKKAISPVIATALLLVVCVVAVVGFQNWYQIYSSEMFSDLEVQSSNYNVVGIETVIGDTLYVKSGSENNLTISKLEIDGVECQLNTHLSLGMNELDVSDCVGSITTSTPDIVLITENNIIEKKVYVDNIVVDLNAINPNCYNSSNIGTLRTWEGCNDMFIVNESMLDFAITNNLINLGEDFYYTYNGINYTFGDSAYNIFTGQVTDMSNLFWGNDFFNADINYWDVSNVQDMGFMFNSVKVLTNL